MCCLQILYPGVLCRQLFLNVLFLFPNASSSGVLSYDVMSLGVLSSENWEVWCIVSRYEQDPSVTWFYRILILYSQPVYLKGWSSGLHGLRKLCSCSMMMASEPAVPIWLRAESAPPAGVGDRVVVKPVSRPLHVWFTRVLAIVSIRLPRLAYAAQGYTVNPFLTLICVLFRSRATLFG